MAPFKIRADSIIFTSISISSVDRNASQKVYIPRRLEFDL